MESILATLHVLLIVLFPPGVVSNRKHASNVEKDLVDRGDAPDAMGDVIVQHGNSDDLDLCLCKEAVGRYRLRNLVVALVVLNEATMRILRTRLVATTNVAALISARRTAPRFLA